MQLSGLMVGSGSMDLKNVSRFIDSRGGEKGLATHAYVYCMLTSLPLIIRVTLSKSRARANSRACQGGRSGQGISCCGVSAVLDVVGARIYS